MCLILVKLLNWRASASVDISYNASVSAPLIYKLACLIDTVCDSSPCQNGGTCSVVAGDVSCACVSGFIGDTCGGKFDLMRLNILQISVIMLADTCMRFFSKLQ